MAWEEFSFPNVRKSTPDWEGKLSLQEFQIESRSGTPNAGRVTKPASKKMQRKWQRSLDRLELYEKRQNYIICIVAHRFVSLIVRHRTPRDSNLRRLASDAI